jgi:hypothetical protein
LVFVYISHNRWLAGDICLEPEVIQARDLNLPFLLLFLVGFVFYVLFSENSPNLLYMYTSGGTAKACVGGCSLERIKVLDGQEGANDLGTSSADIKPRTDRQRSLSFIFYCKMAHLKLLRMTSLYSWWSYNRQSKKSFQNFYAATQGTFENPAASFHNNLVS